MKTLLPLLLLCCLFSIGTRAATLSGTVTNAGTSTPVAGLEVYIFDSVSFHTDTVLTNGSGVYSYTIPTGMASGTQLFVFNYACSFSSQYVTYFGSNITANFSVCATPTYIIQGRVFIAGGSADSLGIVYLIRKAYDPILADTTLTAIDSMGTYSSCCQYGLFYKTYTSMPSGTLLLKAALKPAHSQYSNFLPTYYTSSALWSGATPLTSNNFIVKTNITLIAGTNPGGPGFIGGSVLVGANKTTAVGDPLAKRIIILTTGSNVPVAYTYSNSAGQFSFPNIAYGTYKLFGDAWGKSNPALTVTITQTQGTISNILFQENNKMFWGRIGGLGVAANSLLAGISAYPNPALDYIAVGGLDAISGTKTITLTAVNGAVVARQEVTSGSPAHLSTATLSPGLYVLRVQTSEGTVQIKVTK